MFIVDHLGAMEPAPSVLQLPEFANVLKAADAFLREEKKKRLPLMRDIDFVIHAVNGKLAVHLPVVAGHLLPEDYV